MKYLTRLLIAIFSLLIIGQVSPAMAGEPIGEIGVMNPTMFKCVDKDSRRTIKEQLDPWQKKITRRYEFVQGGVEYDLNSINEILAEYPDAREESCIRELDVDYGFNPYDDKEFNAWLDHLGRECRREDPNGIIVPITDTRIEGYVYEFHPVDPANPATSEWFSVPSKSVMVRARGITFEIYWGSGEEGYYYFPNLGAGPITLDLQLPKDAHPINKDVVIFSSGLEETWTVFLGFYRGDVPPPNPSRLTTPDGSFLPFVTLADIEAMSKCGSTELPEVAGDAVLPLGVVGVSEAGMPNVGGVLEDSSNWTVLITAVLMLTLLGAAGFYTLRIPPPRK
ncbi:MAG: hypothetical protein Kow0031_38120 [Anaerolineae bacterium]